MNNKDYESLGKTLINHNISAKKKFGQNFLHDKNIIKQIVKASNSEGKNIVEVGPGPCLLTKILFCLLYTSPSPRDGLLSRMPSSA